MGNLRVCFEVGEGKITPYLKLLRIKLETQILAHKYTIKCSFRNYTFRLEHSLIAQARTPTRHLQQLEQSVAASYKHSDSKSDKTV